ncbi:alpha/beta hydrolase [Archangium violaceum]|uniref:alpha/beta fold hydrolase n=1 Tax=Archangium violaceum TaxID=83451 RepID=UPI002B2DB1FA|nr:alpha/beta hydrolase [Archangium gephyra]
MHPETGKVLHREGRDLWFGTRGNSAHPPLLLLMGNGCGASFWPEPFCDLLAQGGRRVIRFDYRGTGLSSHEDFDQDPYDLDDLARDALGLLEHLKVERAHLVGLSMGGFIAQRLALRHPERVRSLTSMMSTPDYAVMLHTFIGGEPPTSSLPPPRADWMRALGQLPRDLSPREFLVENWRLANGARAPFDPDYWRELQALAERRGDSPRAGDDHRRAAERTPHKNLLPELPRLTPPSLFIQGSEDPIFPPAHAEAAANAAPRGRLLVVEGMGHALNPCFFPLLTQALLEHTAEPAVA